MLSAREAAVTLACVIRGAKRRAWAWYAVAVALSTVACEAEAPTDPTRAAMSSGAKDGDGGSTGVPSTGGAAGAERDAGDQGSSGSVGGGDDIDGGGGSSSNTSGGDAGGEGGTSPTAVTDVYIGLDNGDLLHHRLDRASGTLVPKSVVAAGSIPSWVAFAPSGLHAYATNENQNQLAAFAVDPGTGDLTFKNRVDCAGGPTHIAVDPSGAWLVSADYGGNTVHLFPIRSDGTLGTSTQTVSPGTFPHEIVFAATGSYFFVPTKGSDAILTYPFAASAPSGSAVIGTPPQRAPTKAGAGPRHFVAHPSLPYAYVVDENDSTVTAFALDRTAGKLTPIDPPIATVPAGTVGNTGAEIAIAPSGKTLYASNRGHESIAAFAIDPATGRLGPPSYTLTGGKTPRSFAIDAQSGILIVAYQDTSSVVTLRIDPATGALTKLQSLAVPAHAMFVGTHVR